MSPEEGKNVDYNNVLQMNCGKADLEKKNIKRYAPGGSGPALPTDNKERTDTQTHNQRVSEFQQQRHQREGGASRAIFHLLSPLLSRREILLFLHTGTTKTKPN
jgi:hypothetical protein